MSAILPPSKRIWWKQPLDRIELTWILIALIWSLILFFMMPYWHVFGKQNLSNEAYRISAESYQKKTQEMVDKVAEAWALGDQVNLGDQEGVDLGEPHGHNRHRRQENAGLLILFEASGIKELAHVLLMQLLTRIATKAV